MAYEDKLAAHLLEFPDQLLTVDALGAQWGNDLQLHLLERPVPDVAGGPGDVLAWVGPQDEPLWAGLVKTNGQFEEAS